MFYWLLCDADVNVNRSFAKIYEIIVDAHSTFVLVNVHFCS